MSIVQQEIGSDHCGVEYLLPGESSVDVLQPYPGCWLGDGVPGTLDDLMS
jgi:hypothetical protein